MSLEFFHRCNFSWIIPWQAFQDQSSAKRNIHNTCRIYTFSNEYLYEVAIILKYSSCFIHVTIRVKLCRKTTLSKKKYKTLI